MGDWRDFPLPDGSYSDATRPFSQQDVVNYLPTFAEQSGTRSRMKYSCVPGMEAFASVGTGPHRGGRDVEGKLFVVSGNKLYQVTPAGVSTEIGTIPGTGLVSMTHNQIANGNQLVIGTGSNSYVYNTVTGVLAANGVPLLSVDFLNQLILGVDQARRFWRYSGLADATSWNTLDNESAESSPDRIVGGIVSQGEWLVFGERTIEPWSNTATQDTAFTRNTGAISERGCINANTIRRLDNTVFFVDNNYIPCRMQGYQPVPIAPKAIVDELSRCDPTKLLAYTWEDRGYVVYYITAQDGRTWGYDVTSQKWHRRESFGLDRWRLNTLFKWNGDWYGGDYTNGKLYRLTWGYVYEGCEIMPRRIRSGVLHNNGNRVFVNAVKLLMNTGQAPSVSAEMETPPVITGALPDGAVSDVVSYQYTITTAYPGQAYTLAVSGTLPPGLTLSATGLLTGTLTTAGGYSWTITASTECSTGTPLADSAAVSALLWGLMTVQQGSEVRAGLGTEIWLSADPLTWPTLYTRTSNYDPNNLGTSYGDGVTYIASGSRADVSRLALQTPVGSSITTTNTATSNSGARIYAVGGLVFRSHSANAEHAYAISEDKGATWTEHDSGANMAGICRLNSGRWIALFELSATQYVAWSDQAVPTTWNAATLTITATLGHDIASDGTTALFIGSDQKVYTSTDGAVWASAAVFPVVIGVPNDIIIKSSGPGVFVVGKDNVTSLYRTANSGAAWATISMGDVSNTRGCLQLQYANGTWVATFAAGIADTGPVYVSTDDAVSFAASTLPYATHTGATVVPVGVTL